MKPMTRKRIFIVEYTAASGERDTKVIKDIGIKALKTKMWMLKHATVMEVVPIRGWQYDSETRTMTEQFRKDTPHETLNHDQLLRALPSPT